jgi:MinD-like ATPase involved in chromosome partitioning or flagellar assembly
MSRVLSVHSFRGGTGKSNLSANLATALALEGRRVAIVDTDIQSPGIHVLFGMPEDRMWPALNDYLYGRCGMEDAAHDVSPEEVRSAGGTVFLVPSSIRAGDIAQVLRDGYDVGLLQEGFHALLDRLRLDYLVIDTHPGLNDETLLSVAVSDVLFLVLRPDRQDFQGTAVTVDVARRLGVPELRLIVNKHAPWIDPSLLRGEVERTYGAPVAGVFAHSDEMLELQSAGVFVLRHPEHEFTRGIVEMARGLLGGAAVVVGAAPRCHPERSEGGIA